ncbi:MAG: NAD-dependent epimerase/dehydratase family protein [Bacteroidales bacterium]|nr:NAD-dependent epimerase/dehydratase family protein [Bacteroidota bacterium]MBL6949546.1 NAD-dependent epimerase/dehydratase family protein [Bacteroidales bacterium]
MKVLVTGANGLLGANIVRELVKRKYDVRIFTRETSDLSGLEDVNVERINGDILDPDSIGKAVEGCDYVIHSAANTSQWPTNYIHYEPVNVTGTKHVINAVKKYAVKRFVFISSANAFGNGTKEHPGTELNEFTGFKYGSGYMMSKFVAQQTVLTEVEQSKLRAIVVNPTFMIGPYDSKPSSGQIIVMGMGKKVQVSPPGGKNFIHVNDAAIGTCNALMMGRIGECYLLASENLSYREFFALLNQVTGETPKSLSLPGALLKTIGTGGTLFEKMSRKPAGLNLVNARLLCLDNYYTGKKAVKALELPQTPIETAIREAIEWFRDNKPGLISDFQAVAPSLQSTNEGQQKRGTK